MILTSCTPALGMLTFQLVSLSKPVGPIMLKNFFNTRQVNGRFPFYKKGLVFNRTRYLPVSQRQLLPFIILR